MIDQEKIKQAVRLLLEGIGEDPSREGLVETPERIARMYEEIYGGLTEDAGVHLSLIHIYLSCIKFSCLIRSPFCYASQSSNISRTVFPYTGCLL